MNDTTRVEIERYLAGGMSPAESSSFLLSLREDREAMSYLARVLEDEAHLFDAVREQAPAPEIRDAAPRLRLRRTRSWRRENSNVVLSWTAGIAAAALMALLFFTRPAPRAPLVSVPREIVSPPIPRAPEPAPSPRRETERTIPPPAPTPPLPPPAPPRDEVPAPSRTESVPKEPDLPPVRAPVGATIVAVAVLERVQGECFELEAAVRKAVKSGASLYSGRGLHSTGQAIVRFADGTRLDLGADATISEMSVGSGGKRISFEVGTLSADVTKQPAGAPLSIVTSQAEIVVLGTRFTVVCAPDSTRVDVREGRVKAIRRSDSAGAEIGAGQFAVVAPGAPPMSKNIPVEDVLLVPAQGKIVGADWRAVRDPDAGTGTALEALRGRSGPLQEAPFVLFTFTADAEKTYFVWVRGKCLAKTNRVEHDAVVLEFVGGDVTEPPGPNKGLTGSLDRALFNGFMAWPGYGWVGGDADEKRDASPVTVRFPRGGRQTIKLYVTEGPIRIDSVWLSLTQKTRPDDAQTGPASGKK